MKWIYSFAALLILSPTAAEAQYRSVYSHYSSGYSGYQQYSGFSRYRPSGYTPNFSSGYPSYYPGASGALYPVRPAFQRSGPLTGQGHYRTIYRERGMILRRWYPDR